jgi:hypothetical protein
MFRITFLCFFIVLLSFQVEAQKVKYKDLYILLKAENYKDADPYLRLYLTQDSEDPHANYSMGKMLLKYLQEGDVLNDSDRLMELADSSLLYFNRALNLTTEKFVKKNDDSYYADFRRRDMRSGKFEVKFSDVQLDMEEKISETKKFKADLELIEKHLALGKEKYQWCFDSFTALATKMPNENMLFFTATLDDVDAIKMLAVKYDSALYHLNTYRALMAGMGGNTSAQDLEQNEIKSYPQDGLASVDFYTETISIIDYKTWSAAISDKILRQIIPLKKRLIAFDERVEELHDLVVHDSLDKRDEVFQLATQNVGRDLRDYMQSSLPGAIFNYRISEINYHSAVNYWVSEVADTLHIGLKLDVLKGFGHQIEGMNKLLAKLNEANNPEQQQMFGDYITARYTDVSGLNAFIKDQVATVKSDSVHLWEWIADLEELDRIAIWKDDSISLIPGNVIEDATNGRYTTVFTDSLAERTIGFYSWHQKGDSLFMAFGVSPSSRKLDTLYVIDVDPVLVDGATSVPHHLVDSLGIGQHIWMLHSSNANESGLYTIRVFISDFTVGLGWSKEFEVPEVPTRSSVDFDSGHIRLLNNEGVEVLVVDRNEGEVVESPAAGGEDEEPEN